MGGNLGTIRISPQVLATIARQATRSVSGVAQIGKDLTSGVDRFLHGRGGEGVRVEVVDDAVLLDLYIIASADVNLYDLGRKIQSQVSRAIVDMVGMPVLAVNVHIEDVRTARAEAE